MIQIATPMTTAITTSNGTGPILRV